MSDRDRWQELDQQATPGPWWLDPHPDALGTVVHAEPHTIAVASRHADLPTAHANADFIANARIGWPAAERECAQLRSERDQACALVQQVRDLRISDSRLPEQLAELQDRIDGSRLLVQTGNEEEHGT